MGTMDTLERGVRVVTRYWGLAMVPLLWDLFQWWWACWGVLLGINTSWHWRMGPQAASTSNFQIKFTLPGSFPSIEQLGITLGPHPAPETGFHLLALVLGVVFLVAATFVRGGYLGCLNASLTGKPVRWPAFAYYGRYYFLRLMSLTLVILFISFLTGLFALVIQGPVFVLVLPVFMVFFIFMDYALVVEDLTVGEALSRGPQVLWSGRGIFVGFIFVSLLLTGSLTWLLNYLGPLRVLLALILYPWLGTGLVAAFMDGYRQVAAPGESSTQAFPSEMSLQHPSWTKPLAWLGLIIFFLPVFLLPWSQGSSKYLWAYLPWHRPVLEWKGYNIHTPYFQNLTSKHASTRTMALPTNFWYHYIIDTGAGKGPLLAW